MDGTVSTNGFYGEYHGHREEHLHSVLNVLRKKEEARAAIYLLGDSSLDNKYWLSSTGKPAINGYEDVLSPAVMKPDVAYWVNQSLMDSDYYSNLSDSESSIPFCINAAVEESTIKDRYGDKLLPQDVFVRDNVKPQDTLIISVGGNDIALHPSVKTGLSVASLVSQPSSWIESGSALGLGHMVQLFKRKIEDFICKICSKTKPKRVVICMIYFLDENPKAESWANTILKCLGYNSNPAKVQLLIKKIYEVATRQIAVEGVEVVAFPLFEVLDGKDTTDYVARVEPSVTGGQKMGRAFVAHLETLERSPVHSEQPS